ncbi:MAG: bacterial transcriptional activator domain-containing protein [Chloroflexi bacterium]|nr:bacterial transcriptional activator domain-containing protein [Chloroflexota bacterium]
MLRPGGKTEALLAALALQPEYGAARATLVERIWPEADTSLAVQSLHSLVYSLHRRLGDVLASAPFVVYSEGRYFLNVEQGVAVDTRQFEALVLTGDEASLRGDMAAVEVNYRSAIQLYRGDVAGITDAHDVVERERLRSLYLSVLARLAALAFDSERYTACLDLSMRLLAADPFREDAHRLAMRCHVRRGERAQAFRQYRLCEDVLRSEFDTQPEPITRELFDRIRQAPDTV